MTGLVPASVCDLSQRTLVEFTLDYRDVFCPHHCGCRPSPVNVTLFGETYSSETEVLHLTGPTLQGTIPSEIGLMTALAVLQVHTCPNVTGTVPTQLGRLTNVNYFNMGYSSITGTIPTEVSLMTSLEHMTWHGTKMNGIIPRYARMLSL